jgi:hypothetical protein
MGEPQLTASPSVWLGVGVVLKPHGESSLQARELSG